MAKLTKTGVGFEFSPEGIAALCTDVPSYFRKMLFNALKRAWDESETFKVELEVSVWESPYTYFLRVKVDPSDKSFTIERSLT